MCAVLPPMVAHARRLAMIRTTNFRLIGNHNVAKIFPGIGVKSEDNCIFAGLMFGSSNKRSVVRQHCRKGLSPNYRVSSNKSQTNHQNSYCSETHFKWRSLHVLVARENGAVTLRVALWWHTRQPLHTNHPPGASVHRFMQPVWMQWMTHSAS